MAGSNILKEFLVKIAFKRDEQQFKNFREGILSLGKTFAELATTGLAASSAIGASTTVMARQMEGLYFASQRTGASTRELKEFSFAASQIGVPDVQHPERDHSTHPHSKIDARANPYGAMRRHHPSSMIGFDGGNSSCRVNQLVPARSPHRNRLMRQRSTPKGHAEGPDLHMPVVIELAGIRHRLAGYRIYGTRPRV